MLKGTGGRRKIFTLRYSGVTKGYPAAADSKKLSIFIRRCNGCTGRRQEYG